MSRSQLHRIPKRRDTGQSTHKFIRSYRLKRAAQLLQHHAGTVSEICYDVGFNSLSHFAKAFREMFGQSPSEYAEKYSTKDR
jgi:AraC-like DNA-binding protein